MKSISVLIPTYNRPDALAVTLTSLCFQNEKDFDVIISDQSNLDIISNNFPLDCAIRLLEDKGHQVKFLKNMPPKGLAQQRQFLLDNCNSPYCLFLDDDLVLESFVLHNMKKTLVSEQCGFVGCAVIGLSYKNDFRPHQHHIEFWNDKVTPEHILPKSKEWERYILHNAANIYHIQEKFCSGSNDIKKYKVAWVGGCVMYNTTKLKEIGGFNFWKELPQNHCGEDVLAQLRVMKKYGGCGIIPSGVYHQELETTVKDRRINAPEYLPI